MKKTLVKRFAALMMALLLAALVPAGAFAENASIATPTDLQPVAEAPVEEPVASDEETETAENASNVTEPEATEEPVAEPAAEPTVEPAAEPTAQPSEEPTAEPTAEPVAAAEENNEEPVETPAVEPTAEPTEVPAEAPEATDQPAEEPTESREENAEEQPAPQGTVTVVLRTAGPLYYGDEVTLGVIVNNVEGDYTITWQAKVAEDIWTDVEVGMTYKFILTPENASTEYRAVLSIVE